MLQKTITIILVTTLLLSCNANQNGKDAVNTNGEETNSNCCNCDESILHPTFDKFEKVISEYELKRVLKYEREGNHIEIKPRIYSKDGFAIRVNFKTDKVIPDELGFDKLIFLFENDSVSNLFATGTYDIPFGANPIKEQNVDFWPMKFEPHSFKLAKINVADNWKEMEIFIDRVLKLKVKSIRLIKNGYIFDFDLKDWEQTYFMKVFQCLWDKMY